MGEIKSTLDLVLERTRDLTLSDAEKQRLKQEDFRKRIRGLIVRFQKGADSITATAAQLTEAGAEFGREPQAECFCEVLKAIDLDSDNAPLLSLARQVCHRDTRDIEMVLAEYADAVASERNHRQSVLRKQLADVHGITGDAVVPNLDADSNWEATRQQIRNRHLRRLQDVSKTAGCR